MEEGRIEQLINTKPLNGREPLAGFRLWSLEVLNWGTFHEARWLIEPNGHNGLLTGDIGSGKSTLVDALTCLLVPYNKITFNKAAGAEGKERNLLSYVKGEYKKEKEEVTKVAKKVYLRPDNNTYTVIIGHFKNEGYHEDVCLAQVYWVGKENKVEKLLIISSVPLNIKDHFSQFSDVNDLKKKLRNYLGVQLFGDNFSKYSEYFRRLFGMNSEKAIDLFNQTVSMKSVSSLTDFVREQMLEKTDVREQIGLLLKRFEDLKKAHEAVVHSREQYMILKPLTESALQYGEVTREIESIEKMLEIAPIWFTEQKWGLLQNAIEKTEEALDKLIVQENLQLRELEDLERRKESILVDIAGSGGKRIEQIGEEIQRHEGDKVKKQYDFDQYEKLTQQVGLRKVESEKDFEFNKGQADQLIAVCDQKEIEYRDQRDNRISALRSLESDYALESEELRSLKDRRTQIPAWLISFRTRLCDDLRIAEEQLPFVGELLQVNTAEKLWEGAIEKLLHGAGISLLVPSWHYRSVSRYVNDNPMRSANGRGIKLTYLEADLKHQQQMGPDLDVDSVACKIDVKPDSDFCDWLEYYIKRNFGDYICADVEGLQRVPFGITRQGLIKSGRIRHTKDDRSDINDRKNYVLGWSNVEKIKAVEGAVQKLETSIAVLKTAIDGIETGEKENKQQKEILSRLLYIREYISINWQYHAGKIYALDNERNELLHNNDTLAQLERNKQEVQELIDKNKTNGKELTEKKGGLKSKLEEYKEAHEESGNTIQSFPETLKEQWYPIIMDKFGEVALTLKTIDKRHEEFRKRYQGENGLLKRIRGKQLGYANAVVRKMMDIKEHSKAEYSELSADIDARAEYIKKFEQLSREDLKRHEERFKEQLNTNVINSISVFDNQLQKHESDIKQKIRTINQNLEQIEYNAAQDTYITILMETTTNKEVRLFREELKNCYMHSFSSKNELYTEAKYEQVKAILDRFASMEYTDREWTATVTDVRKWFEFNASERYRADDSEKEFYEGSGGKSGGQKEKLAYTILASALAYQFGLQLGETKSRSFRFVVIDEAFGKGSDESTRYGLELFKKLNLQLLIVTPLQKIHVIDGHVNSFHFVSNAEGNNSQIYNLTKIAYMERKKSHEMSNSIESISTENMPNP